jgi:hypothetical protein
MNDISANTGQASPDTNMYRQHGCVRASDQSTLGTQISPAVCYLHRQTLNDFCSETLVQKKARVYAASYLIFWSAIWYSDQKGVDMMCLATNAWIQYPTASCSHRSFIAWWLLVCSWRVHRTLLLYMHASVAATANSRLLQTRTGCHHLWSVWRLACVVISWVSNISPFLFGPAREIENLYIVNGQCIRPTS